MKKLQDWIVELAKAETEPVSQLNTAYKQYCKAQINQQLKDEQCKPQQK